MRSTFHILIPFVLVATSFAVDPPWWQQRGVLDPLSASNNKGPLKQGQLKQIARAAFLEFDQHMPGGSGLNITILVTGWSQSPLSTKNGDIINTGQLKHVASLFYDVLIARGFFTSYPWTAATGDDRHYSPALIGQAKNLFAFDISTDADSDGLPDLWEQTQFGNTSSQSGSGDADSDGLSNRSEFLAGTRPVSGDSDGDSVPDGSEDPDEDGLTILTEIANGLNLSKKDNPVVGLS